MVIPPTNTTFEGEVKFIYNPQGIIIKRRPSIPNSELIQVRRESLKFRRRQSGQQLQAEGGGRLPVTPDAEFRRTKHGEFVFEHPPGGQS